jgi:hypothetical protein
MTKCPMIVVFRVPTNTPQKNVLQQNFEKKPHIVFKKNLKK